MERDRVVAVVADLASVPDEGLEVGRYRFERASAGGELGALDPAQAAFGVFGRRCPPDTLLVDGDRVEIYRPLVADPKTLRRLRAGQSDAARGALRRRSGR